MSSEANRSWTIKTSSDLFEKAKRDLARFRSSHEQGDGEQVDHAVNCAITLWHLHDWLWHENKDRLSSMKIEKQTTFQEWLKSRPRGDVLALCERLANGTKHLHLNKAASQDATTSISRMDRPDSMDRTVRRRLEAGERYVVWGFTAAEARDALVLTDIQGRNFRVDWLFDQVIAFWEDLLTEWKS